MVTTPVLFTLTQKKRKRKKAVSFRDGNTRRGNTYVVVERLRNPPTPFLSPPLFEHRRELVIAMEKMKSYLFYVCTTEGQMQEG